MENFYSGCGRRHLLTEINCLGYETIHSPKRESTNAQRTPFSQIRNVIGKEVFKEQKISQNDQTDWNNLKQMPRNY